MLKWEKEKTPVYSIMNEKANINNMQRIIPFVGKKKKEKNTCGSDSKEFACNVGDLGSIRGLGTSPGEGNGYPLQYSCLENPMDRGTWWATVHGVAKSWTQPSD